MPEWRQSPPQQRSASDSNLRCGKEEWFRLQQPWRQGVERGGGPFRGGRAMSVAAFKAGAAHPRRQKFREMPPPGASAPAFAATIEPASTQITSGIPPTDLRRDSSNERVLKMACCMHRFLISSPNLGIDASFSPITPSFVHRFLISSPNLGIDVSFSPETSFCVHRFLISGPDLGIDASFSPFTPSCVHRFLISGPDLRIDAAQSS